MSATIQPGMHPDAESLTAFAEQLLPAAERDQVLSHMATCGRCREVVFLALQAASEGRPAPVDGSSTAPRKQRAPWFNGWKWMWIPAAAFAGFIGVAVVQHFRHAAESTQTSARLSQTDALPEEVVAKSAPANTRQAQPTAGFRRMQPAKTSEVRDDALSRAREDKDEAKQLDEKKSVERKELAGAAGAPVVVSPGQVGGSVLGTMAAKEKSSPYGGPSAANQFQQQNPAQQNALQQSQNVETNTTNKPAMTNRAPASASQSVTVQAEGRALAPTPAPAAPPQVSATPLSEQKYDVSARAKSALDKVQKISLPNGLGALSVASEAGRSVALDTAGAMFLSEDSGEHWQSIQTQWTGHAVLVRTLPPSPVFDSLKRIPPPRFELVNDKLQTWVSLDGKSWSPKPVPLK